LKFLLLPKHFNTWLWTLPVTPVHKWTFPEHDNLGHTRFVVLTEVLVGIEGFWDDVRRVFPNMSKDHSAFIFQESSSCRRHYYPSKYQKPLIQWECHFPEGLNPSKISYASVQVGLYQLISSISVGLTSWEVQQFAGCTEISHYIAYLPTILTIMHPLRVKIYTSCHQPLLRTVTFMAFSVTHTLKSLLREGNFWTTLPKLPFISVVILFPIHSKYLHFKKKKKNYKGTN